MVHFDRSSPSGSDATPLRICIAAVGGAGSNVLERIIKDRTLNATMISIQTDVRVLSTSSAPQQIQLGDDLMRGVGAGGDPELGREGAMFSAEQIRSSLAGHDIVFLTVGLGGGTGSGAAPVVAEIAKSTGALVLVFAAVPFSFEGRRRQSQSREALDRLEKTADALVLFENDRMGELVLAKEGIQKAFTLADRTVGHSIRAVANMVSAPGIVKLSLGDLMSALRSTDSRCLFGHGEASGKDRGTEALKAALKSPLLSETMLNENATSLLVHVVGGESLTLTEVEDVMRQLGRHVPDHTQIHFGLGVNPAMGDKVSVTLISSMSANALANYRATAPQAITAPVPVTPARVNAAPVVAKRPLFQSAPQAVAPTPAVVAAPDTIPEPLVPQEEPPPTLAQVLKASVSKPAAAPAKPVAQVPAVSLQQDDLFASVLGTSAAKPAPQKVAPAEPPADLFSPAPLSVNPAPVVEKVETVVAAAPEEDDAPPEPLFEPVAVVPEPEVAVPQRLASVLGQAVASSSTYSSQMELVDEIHIEEPEDEESESAPLLYEEAEYEEEPQPVAAHVAPAVLTPMPETAPVPRAAPVLSRTPAHVSTPARAPVPAARVADAPAAVSVTKPEVQSVPRGEPARSIVSSTAVPSSVRSLTQPQEQPMLAIAGGGNERSSHFRGADETIVQGEDLDTPTWMRLRRKVTR